MMLLRMKSVSDGKITGAKMKKVDMKPFFGQLTFSFTDAQNKVFNEIRKDMSSGKVMNRLVQGDVGQRKNRSCHGGGIYGGQKRISGGYDGTDRGACGTASGKL